ncbi:hypothetical protein [Terribacillus sp. 7520-G]|uniref:hypothetical protein n=1 Tax=Terribacillus sp. 7520-G TaxID=2025389 RepID=UPI000BA772E2|nr:hypothetical protein [Terribacillus sp. 7520-G]PAD39520.1 hypothetical protein CHH53_04725 [Terribacillus sp. 7520-G]
MSKFKNKYIYIIIPVILVIIIGFIVRVNIVNDERKHFETYRVDVHAGEVITMGDLELTYGKASEPLIKQSEDYPDKQDVVFELPIKITKKSSSNLDIKNKFAIYEQYKGFINLATVAYTSDALKQDNRGLFNILSDYQEGKSIDLKITTDLKLGEFYYYYNDYNIDKPAYIVIAGPQSPKGIPLYYYKLQE